ncbi:MAG: transglutaminase-like domain-containing protein [Nanoarchaeota archaeon]
MEKIHDEIRREALSENEKPKGTNPLIYIVGGFMVLIMVMMIVPHYSIKPDTEPVNIPSLEEVRPNTTQNYSRPQLKDIRLYVTSDNPTIKRMATKIATTSCKGEKICQSKAIYYFVRDNFEYVGEQDEYIQTPMEMLYTGGGDCDDFAVLLASMQNAIGIPVRFVRVPNHIYISIYIEEAPSKYKKDRWIPLDAACRNCEYAQIPLKYKEAEKEYLS